MRALLLLLPILGAGALGAAEGRPRIVATSWPVWLLTRCVAGDLAVERLLPAGLGCPHDYALTPADLRRLEGASLLVANGGGLEGFLPRLRALRPDLAVCEAAGAAPAAPAAASAAATAGHHHHDDEAAHAWMNPAEAARMTAAISERLAALDAPEAGGHRARGGLAAQALDDFAKALRAEAAPLHGLRVVDGHGLFGCFAEAIGVEVAATVDNEPGHAPAAAELIALVAKAREAKAAAVLVEAGREDPGSRALAAELGIPLVGLDALAGGPEDAGLAHYQAVLRADLAALRKAVGR